MSTAATVVRRLITIPAVIIALPILIISSPVWVVGGVVLDLAQGLTRLPTVRLGLFAIVYVLHEYIGLGCASALYLRGFGRSRCGNGDAPDLAGLDRYRRVQIWWAGSLLSWAKRLLNVQLELPDDQVLPPGEFILLSRHASMVDAILPIHLIAAGTDRFVPYVLKRELQWDPNIDVFGHRLRNYFVTRERNTAAERHAITRFARQAVPGSVLVIFPEGTYASEPRRAAVKASLARKGQPELLALANELDHLLPPKPLGTLALLTERPELDVVIFGHVGLEGVAHLSGLRRQLPLTEPVRIGWWYRPRPTIPTDDDNRIDWLNDEWRTLDRWVDSQATSATNRRSIDE